MSEETGAAEATTPTETAPVEAAPVAAPSILDNFQDSELRAYAETKGFDKAGFEGVVKSYSHLEKMNTNHESTVVIPGFDAPTEQTDAFYNRLGCPEAQDGYSFKLEEGADTARLHGLREVAHSLGITDKQFTGLAEADSNYNSSVVEINAKEIAQSAQDAQNALKRDWGAAYEQNLALTDRYAEQLGVTEDQMAGLAKTLGTDEAIKFVHGLGSKLGDDTVDAGGIVDNGIMTPDQAQVELRALTEDKEFMEAWLNKGHIRHGDAVAKKASLARQASGIPA